MGCPFDEKCNYWNKGDGRRNKCLSCPKWEGNLSQPITSRETFRIDATELPVKNPQKILIVIRTLPRKEATVLIQKYYLRYTNIEIAEYHGLKTKSAVSHILRRATKNVLKKLRKCK